MHNKDQRTKEPTKYYVGSFVIYLDKNGFSAARSNSATHPWLPYAVLKNDLIFQGLQGVWHPFGILVCKTCLMRSQANMQPQMQQLSIVSSDLDVCLYLYP